jgi:hypothetical protein
MSFDPTTLLSWTGGLSTLSLLTAVTDGARDFNENGIDYYGVRKGSRSLFSVFTVSCALCAGSWFALLAYKFDAAAVAYITVGLVAACSALLLAQRHTKADIDAEAVIDDLPNTLTQPLPIGELVQLLGPLSGGNSETGQVQYTHEDKVYTYTAMVSLPGSYDTHDRLRVASIDQAGILHLSRD